MNIWNRTCKDYRHVAAIPTGVAINRLEATPPRGGQICDDGRRFGRRPRRRQRGESGRLPRRTDEIAWFDRDAALAHDLPSIIRVILTELAAREAAPGRPIPHHRFDRGAHRLRAVCSGGPAMAPSGSCGHDGQAAFAV